MKRAFQEWWKVAQSGTFQGNMDKKPLLNQVNYLWINSIIGKNSDEIIPSVEELVEWITSGNIDAIRK